MPEQKRELNGRGVWLRDGESINADGSRYGDPRRSRIASFWMPDGAVIHIVPRVAGAKSGGVFQIVLGAAAIAGSFFTAGATLAAWGAAIGAGGMTGILFSLGASMVLGGVAQMLAPKARTPRTQTTDNGKQNTYFSSLDNMVAQGNVLPVLYGEMRVGSRVVSQEISTADEGDGGQVVVIGR